MTDDLARPGRARDLTARAVSAPFVPRVFQAGDGTTLVELDPRDSVISDHPPASFRIVYRGLVFGRAVRHEHTALSHVEIQRLTAEGAVRFRELT